MVPEELVAITPPVRRLMPSGGACGGIVDGAAFGIYLRWAQVH